MRKKLVFLPDGTSAWVDPSEAPVLRERTPGNAGVHVSNMTFSCMPEQVAERMADDKLHGFNVEYKPDYTTKAEDGSYDSYNAHIPASQLERYRQHHDKYDKNSKNGSKAMLSAELLAEAERRVRAKYPTKERV